MTRVRRTHALAAAVALLGGFAPAFLAAQMPTTPLLRAGQSVKGQIEMEDDELKDGSKYDIFEFDGAAGASFTTCGGAGSRSTTP